MLGVRLAFGAIAERHGRVARLPQQQVVLEERRHGHRHAVQQRDGVRRVSGHRGGDRRGLHGLNRPSPRPARGVEAPPVGRHLRSPLTGRGRRDRGGHCVRGTRWRNSQRRACREKRFYARVKQVNKNTHTHKCRTCRVTGRTCAYASCLRPSRAARDGNALLPGDTRVRYTRFRQTYSPTKRGGERERSSVRPRASSADNDWH